VRQSEARMISKGLKEKIRRLLGQFCMVCLSSGVRRHKGLD
jgi:hypothetical protein